MATYVKYSDYDAMVVEEVRMDIDCEQYKVLKPITRTIIEEVDGKEKETIEYLLEIKTVDERMVYELIQHVDQKELASLIRVLQTLNKQIIAGNAPQYSNTHSCVK